MVAVFCDRGCIAVCDGKDGDANTRYFSGNIADREKVAREREQEGKVFFGKVLKMELRLFQIP